MYAIYLHIDEVHGITQDLTLISLLITNDKMYWMKYNFKFNVFIRDHAR